MRKSKFTEEQIAYAIRQVEQGTPAVATNATGSAGRIRIPLRIPLTLMAADAARSASAFSSPTIR